MTSALNRAMTPPTLSWMNRSTGTAGGGDRQRQESREISPTATRTGAPVRIRLITFPPHLVRDAWRSTLRGSTRAEPQQTGTSDSPLNERVPLQKPMNGVLRRPTRLPGETAPASLLTAPAGDQEVP